MTTTLENQIDQAMDEAADREFAYSRFMPGTALSPALAQMVKRCDGVFWMLTAIASWVTVGGRDIGNGQFDENGMNPGTYRRLLDRWSNTLQHMQLFELRRYGDRGAELCIRGGADATDDDSETLHPIQRWGYAQIPWSDDEPFRVWAGSQLINDRAVWVLMLPREY